MRRMRFHLKEVNHVPGKELYIADALSRMQPSNSDKKETVPDEEMNIYVDSVLDSLPVSDGGDKGSPRWRPCLSKDKELPHGRLARQISPSRCNSALVVS